MTLSTKACLDLTNCRSKQAIVDKVIEGVHLFDPTLTTCLATDFSATGVGFFLLQKTCKCTSRTPTCCHSGWRLCLGGSRFLHPAETRYAPIEGEALAVAYGLHQCRYFILGCEDLIVCTDHKPLLNVLNDRDLSTIQNRRLQNLKEKTLSYKFEIVHVPGRKHIGPDAASRYPVGEPTKLILPGEPVEADVQSESEVGIPPASELGAILLDTLESQDDTDEDCENFLDHFALSAITELNSASPTTKSYSNMITWADVRTATITDTTIQTVLQLLTTGFPDDARTLPASLRPYHPLSSNLYELDGVLMLSDRIVVPVSLRPAILRLLHAAHQGVDRMKARATATVYWPGITGQYTVAV